MAIVASCAAIACAQRFYAQRFEDGNEEHHWAGFDIENNSLLSVHLIVEAESWPEEFIALDLGPDGRGFPLQRDSRN